MTIIIEGVDRIGKTTLANELIKKYKCDYLHFTKDDPRDYNFYLQTMRKQNVIYDRHFIGEMIYPAVFNRPEKLYLSEFYSLLEESKKLKVLIVILYTSDLSILKSRMNTEQHIEVKQQYESINNQFKIIAEKKQDYILSFDISKITLKAMVNEIDKLSI